MLTLKINRLLLFAAIILFGSCLQNKVVFSYKDNVNLNLFSEIPELTKSILPLKDSVNTVDSIAVYRTVFRERYIENDNIVDISLLNDSTRLPYVKYSKVIGSRQDVYLFRLYTSPEKSNAFIFFSAKYNADKECIGFGPSYFGYQSNRENMTVIDFAAELKPKFRNDAYRFYKYAKTRMLFIADDNGDENRIAIKKIVLKVPNKIGSEKSLVFPVAEIFGDSAALQFDYYKTITPQ